MLKSQSLSFKYSAENQFDFPDLQCSSDHPLVILGESGCGKTTLLHLIAGLLKPAKGEIWVDGKAMTGLKGAKLDRFRADKMGVIFQRSYFVDAISVLDNLLLVQGLGGKTPDRKHCLNILNRLGIDNKASSLPARLSSGEQQRLTIARALVNRPSIVLADEPTSALDDKNCNLVLDMLFSAAKELGTALLVVTHDQRVKDRFSNQIRL